MPFLRSRHWLALVAAFPILSHAQSIERVMPGDATLDCAALVQAQTSLDEIIAAGDPKGNPVAKAVAGTAANVGGQVAGGAIAQSVGGLFGAFGSVVSKAAGVVAQQTAEEQMAPDAAAQQRAVEAQARRDFLSKVATAKSCKPDDPSFAGNALTQEQFNQLAAPSATNPLIASLTPLTVESIQPALSAPSTPLDLGPLLKGDLKLAGKKLLISEYRVLFEVGGEVTANTRAGYLLGTSYGGTNSRTIYKVANVDIAALQALTDRAWKDFTERLAASGVQLEDRNAFIAAHGEVYPATEAASLPGAPVYVEQNLGYTERKYLVMAPTGMKLLSRGFAGIGAGNMGKRVDWIKGGVESVSIGVAINIAELETSGGGSSILHRDGSATRAGESMTIAAPHGQGPVAALADASAMQMEKAFAVEGSFANFRQTGGYDSNADAVAKTMALVSNMAGVAANKTKRVEFEVDLDGPSTARMALQGLSTFNVAAVKSLAGAR